LLFAPCQRQGRRSQGIFYKGRQFMKKKILIIDDDASVRKALGRVLEEEGYQIILAADGREAIEKFESDAMDLLLLDIGLPIRNGWDTFERISSQALVCPIIMVIGKANQCDIAVAAGLGALMEKPLDVPQLLQKIQELLVEPPDARLRRLSGCSHDAHFHPSQSTDSQCTASG
jgi:DNA-binding response OmpR family regulator